MKVRELIELLQAEDPEALVQVGSCCYPPAPPMIASDDGVVMIDQSEARSYVAYGAGAYDD